MTPSRVTWLTSVCNAHAYVTRLVHMWYDSFKLSSKVMYITQSYVTWLVHASFIGEILVYIWYYSFVCNLNRVCVGVCVYVWVRVCVFVRACVRQCVCVGAQPIIFGVSFKLNLQSQSQRYLFNGTWQKGHKINWDLRLKKWHSKCNSTCLHLILLDCNLNHS